MFRSLVVFMQISTHVIRLSMLTNSFQKLVTHFLFVLMQPTFMMISKGSRERTSECVLYLGLFEMGFFGVFVISRTGTAFPSHLNGKNVS